MSDFVQEYQNGLHQHPKMNKVTQNIIWWIPALDIHLALILWYVTKTISTV